jgi:hypothetical protein
VEVRRTLILPHTSSQYLSDLIALEIRDTFTYRIIELVGSI